MTKIIFLDIDGVLCTATQAIAIGDYGVVACLDPVALRFFDRVCEKSNVKIVISSTWRHGSTKGNFEQLFAGNSAVHLAKSLHEDWRTESLPGKCRGEEIDLWLYRNRRPQYLIVDDDIDFLGYQKPRHVRTCTHNGMNFSHYKNCLDLLGIKDF